MRGLTVTALKWIALVTMLVDHIGYVFISHMSYPVYVLCRSIGRLSFPIFCFCLVEGYIHTKNFGKYLTRIGIFAVLSEVPFDMMTKQAFVYTAYNNVLITFFIGLLVLKLCDVIKERCQKQTFRIVLWVLAVAAGMGIAYFARSDYSWQGVLIIACMYFFRQRKWLMNLTVGLSLCLKGNVLELFAPLALVPVYFYNGRKSLIEKEFPRYFFYVVYPLHLLLLGILGIYY